MPIPLPILDTPAPFVALSHLDDLWFQVAGTLCNLTCRHCFISCSPHNHSFGFLESGYRAPRVGRVGRFGREGILFHRRRTIFEP